MRQGQGEGTPFIRAAGLLGKKQTCFQVHKASLGLK